jgi:hypothetical protein
MSANLHALINPGDVAGLIGGYFGVASGDPRILRLVSAVLPDMESAAARDPSISWKSSFPSVIQKYESLAKDLGLGVSAAQRDMQTIRHANATDANFAGALGRLGWEGLQHHAMLAGRRSDASGGSGSAGSEHSSSTAYTRELPLGITGANHFAKELGIGSNHAGFFVGISHGMQDALRDAIKHGKAINDDQVKNARDVSAVIGAIRAGKLKPDDPRVPPSVRKIMEDMKSKGIDPATADPKAIDKYFKDNPKALEAVKAQNAKDIARKDGSHDAKVAEAEKKAQLAPEATPTKKAKLGISFK